MVSFYNVVTAVTRWIQAWKCHCSKSTFKGAHRSQWIPLSLSITPIIWNNVYFCIECRKCIVLIWVVKLLCVCQSIVCVCVREIKFCYFPQVRTESWNSNKKVVFSGVLVFECSAGLKYCRREGGRGSRNSRGSEHYRGSMYRPSSTLTTESN